MANSSKGKLEANTDAQIDLEKAGPDANLDGDLPSQPPLAENPVVDVQPVTTPEPTARKNQFLVFLLGGIVAGGIGFLIAQYMGNDRWPFAEDTAVTDQLASEIVRQEEIILVLQDSVQALSKTIETKPDIAALENLTARLQSVSSQQDYLTELIAELSDRLVVIENRPIPDVGANRQAVEIYGKELAAMRAMFEGELARIEAAQVKAFQEKVGAEELSRNGTFHTALAQITVAMQAGTPFSGALDELTNAGFEYPPGLSTLAAQGIPTLAKLAEGFPVAARNALTAAVTEPADSGQSGGVVSFLRSQLGVRSLEPQEGDGVDAILSRAESAMKNADISAALVELGMLSGASLGEMRAWMDMAQTRQQTLDMVATLSSSQGN